MAVIAKFRVTSIEDFGGTSKRIKMNAIYDLNGIPENQRFTKATPWGELIMMVDNLAASEQLVIGRDFYVTFDPIEKPVI